MKSIELEQVTLDACIKNAQKERVVITRNGKPVALIVGVEGMDEEQLQLGSSDKFWKLIEKRRKDKTISRKDLEQQPKNKNENGGKKRNKISSEAQTIKNQLAALGFTKHEIIYMGCPDHPQNTWACPIEQKGKHEGWCECKGKKGSPYWTIDGESLTDFEKALMKQSVQYITYIFIESDFKEVRKIGEGEIIRIRANLKAHYNHGSTKSPKINENRKSGNNSIAKKCRNAKCCYVFIRPADGKNEKECKNKAKEMESTLKKQYRGWLDFD